LSKNISEVYLKNYQPSEFDIQEIILNFEIKNGNNVLITNTSTFQKRNTKKDLILNGSNELLTLKSIKLNDKILESSEYSTENSGNLKITNVPDKFILEIVTELKPEENTGCIGLYTSEGIICTQCESEGFRNMTYALDRPDVFSKFVVTIKALKKDFPYLLSNGKKTKSIDLDNGFHSITWEDNRPKPPYLFALAAGDFDVVKDIYQYPDGKEVKLEHYVNKGDAGKVKHAMECLKAAMEHEYKRWGHTYHSDSCVFMTLAVDAFVFGAMENTGLNIFNSSAILANSETATDAAFARIDEVVDHEFCHDESGNWGVPRDWFQISFKEGLTVFRDQTYSADKYGKTLQLIKDIRILRGAVFAYDSGTMTHPMVLQSYLKTENNYDVLTYPKGAAVNRMVEALVTENEYKKAYRKFFNTHGEKSVTIEEYFRFIAKSADKNLDQFIDTWLNQAGVPTLEVSGDYLDIDNVYNLTIKQILPVSADDPTANKKPFYIPLKIGLIGPDGIDFPVSDDGLLEISQEENKYSFPNISQKPRLSINRDGLAYAKITYSGNSKQTFDDLSFLAKNDSNAFKRWDALQELSLLVLQKILDNGSDDKEPSVDKSLIDAFRSILKDDGLDDGLKAEMLSLPTVNNLINLQKKGTIDPIFVYNTRKFVVATIANALTELFLKTYKTKQTTEKYVFSPEEMNRRSLMNLCLSYLVKTDNTTHLNKAKDQFDKQDNFNDVLSAVQIITASENKNMKNNVLQTMYDKYKDDKLVMNNWLSIQASAESTGIKEIKELEKNPVFDNKNPNKIRALINSFANNILNFHKKDGSGYKFLADWIIKIDEINVTVAGSLSKVFTKIGDYTPERQQQIMEQMQRIKHTRGDSLSPNVAEVLNRSL